jgi:hypothetical protein
MTEPPPPPPKVTGYRIRYVGTLKAGSSFRATGLDVDLSDGTERTVPARSCSATLAKKTLVGTGSGHCRFKIPRIAKGKRLLVRVSAKYKSELVTCTGSATVLASSR